MDGILIFDYPTRFVGKKKEYPTKEEFKNAIKEEYEKDIELKNIYEGYVRYFPNGVEDSREEFGDVGVFQLRDKHSKGSASVWVVEE